MLLAPELIFAHEPAGGPVHEHARRRRDAIIAKHPGNG